jgi:Ca2+-binding RTX toxin-like protein
MMTRTVLDPTVPFPLRTRYSDGNDRITVSVGDSSVDDFRVLGGPGSDVLQGSAGNDTLDGGAGRDILIYGDGNNLVLGGDEGDLIVPRGSVDAALLPGDPRLADTLYPAQLWALAAPSTYWRMTGTLLDRTVMTELGAGNSYGGTYAANPTFEWGFDGYQARGVLATGDERYLGKNTVLGGAGEDMIAGGSGNNMRLGTQGHKHLPSEAANDSFWRIKA